MEILIMLLGILIILLGLAFHLWAMPSLLQIALEALGKDFTFIQCLAFWILTVTVVKLISNTFKKESK